MRQICPSLQIDKIVQSILNLDIYELSTRLSHLESYLSILTYVSQREMILSSFLIEGKEVKIIK